MESLGTALVAFLVFFPMFMALVMLLARKEGARTVLTVAGAVLVAAASILTAAVFGLSGSMQMTLDTETAHLLNVAALAVDVLLGFYIVSKAVRHGRGLVAVLALVQTILAIWFEIYVAEDVSVSHALYIDGLSVVMALIIGIVGSGIAVYALGYMRDHHDGRHPDVVDRRPVFFAVVFLFLGAMFAIVFANNLAWMFCAWEITTVCSFALIGYDKTKVATANAFRQILLNMVGGLAFVVALIWIAEIYGVLELDQFITQSSQLLASGSGTEFIAYMPVLLLALAAFTKAAQFPFHSWLLGAMVAPTPTSALLHSSTMVKAGVFLLVKLAPCLGANIPGYMVMTVGIATFLFAALAAISQSNAKRVLAYSTISNLGLIVACAGVGTDGAVWAAIFLIIFHAVAKSLLFLAVGTAEHRIGSRDIEDMDLLFERMPRLARLMSIGIMGMFIAPFGMLVSKWAALQSFAEASNVVLLLVLAFGSAATFMFWAKWLGKLLAVSSGKVRDLEEGVHSSEWASLALMCVLTVGCCIAFPLISQVLVVPYLQEVFTEVGQDISVGDLWIMSVIALVVAVVFLGASFSTKKKQVPVYMAGAACEDEPRSFSGSLGAPVPSAQRNWYMRDLFDEKKTAFAGSIVALVLIVGTFGFVGQTTVDSKESIETYAAEHAIYAGSEWEEAGISFTTFDSYYQQYAPSYEQYASEYAAMGIGDIKTFMDFLYEQLSQSYSSSSSSSSSSGSSSGSADESAGSSSSEGSATSNSANTQGGE